MKTYSAEQEQKEKRVILVQQHDSFWVKRKKCACD